MLGLTVRGQNGERWQRKSNGFHMRVWPGLVGKTLLHRVGISRAFSSCIGLPL